LEMCRLAAICSRWLPSGKLDLHTQVPSRKSLCD
jgi:hypothetical protein